MKKFILTIEKLNSKGAGLARHEGKIYFVPWTVPGDTVEATVEKEVETFGDAKLTKLMTPSSHRQKPMCPVFMKCGGCTLQHLEYKEQLVQKKIIIKDSLKKQLKVDCEVDDVLPSKKIWNYRNRIQVHTNKKGVVGFFEHQSHDIVTFDECFIAEKELNQKLKELKNQQIKGPQSIELRSSYSKGFEQVNSEQNKILQDQVVASVSAEPGDLIADVYCGSGNFTFALAQKAARVIGFEKSSEALQLAQTKSLQTKTENIQWRLGEASRLLYQCVQEKISFKSMVFDPPRKGLEDVLKFIGLLAPLKIVLVSCDVAAFAKDIKGLTDLGYQLKKVTPLDMFPQTHHVEIVALLTKIPN